MLCLAVFLKPRYRCVLADIEYSEETRGTSFLGKKRKAVFYGFAGVSVLYLLAVHSDNAA